MSIIDRMRDWGRAPRYEGSDARERVEALAAELRERALTRANGLLPSQLFPPKSPPIPRNERFPAWVKRTAALLEECAREKR